MKWLLIGFLRGYRLLISPPYGQVCRYYPSCSAYALESVERHGTVRGGWLSLQRIGRCHPWAAGGPDPVPAEFSWRPIAPGERVSTPRSRT
ncbi:MAG: membrane protein insertion efficiency factor YidD [Nocardioidaceae bacterium]